MEKLQVLPNLVSKLNAFLDALVTFKKELDKDGFSIDKITLLVPSFLALVKALADVKEAKAELLDAFKDDDQIVELLKLALSVKNSVVALVDVLSKDPKSVQLLLASLEDFGKCGCLSCGCKKDEE